MWCHCNGHLETQLQWTQSGNASVQMPEVCVWGGHTNILAPQLWRKDWAPLATRGERSERPSREVPLPETGAYLDVPLPLLECRKVPLLSRASLRRLQPGLGLVYPAAQLLQLLATDGLLLLERLLSRRRVQGETRKEPLNTPSRNRYKQTPTQSRKLQDRTPHSSRRGRWPSECMCSRSPSPSPVPRCPQGHL